MRILYVDGAALDGAISKLARSLGLESVPFNHQAFFGRFSAERIYYYDAQPTQKSGESTEDYEKRKQPKQKLFSHLNQLAGVHVRTGTTRWSNGKQQRQKAVDVLLAVDAVSHAFQGVADFSTFLLNDLDFYPVLETLLHTRVRTHLVYRRDVTASELIEAADLSEPLTATRLLEGCEASFAESHRAKPSGHSGEISDGERSRAVTAWHNGHELAVWKSDEGSWIAYKGGERSEAGSMDLAIERYFGSGLENFVFSDGSRYPS